MEKIELFIKDNELHKVRDIATFNSRVYLATPNGVYYTDDFEKGEYQRLECMSKKNGGKK